MLLLLIFMPSVLLLSFLFPGNREKQKTQEEDDMQNSPVVESRTIRRHEALVETNAILDSDASHTYYGVLRKDKTGKWHKKIELVVPVNELGLLDTTTFRHENRGFERTAANAEWDMEYLFEKWVPEKDMDQDAHDEWMKLLNARQFGNHEPIVYQGNRRWAARIQAKAESWMKEHRMDRASVFEAEELLRENNNYLLAHPEPVTSRIHQEDWVVYDEEGVKALSQVS